MPADKIVTKKLIQVPEGRRIFLNLSVKENLELCPAESGEAKELLTAPAVKAAYLGG